MPSTKRCFKCARTLPLADFYKHAMMADGHLNKCTECTRRDVKRYRANNAEYYRDYDRARRPRKQRVRDSEAERVKRAARIVVGNAIRDGKLFRKPCEVCGSPTVDGHHDDYSKPLDVRWLCRAHHAALHAAYRANAA